MNPAGLQLQHYVCLQGTYFDELIESDTAYLLFSQYIDDPYYNFIGVIEATSIEDILRHKSEFVKRHRRLAAYVSPIASPALASDLLREGFQLWATDAWLHLALDGTVEVDPPPGIHLEYLTNTKSEAYVDAFRLAYSGTDPDEPYGDLDEGYVTALEQSIQTQTGQCEKRFIQALDGNRVVGVASAFVRTSRAGVYGVGVVPMARRRGIGRALMDQLAADLYKDGVESIFLQTEARSAVEQWYLDLGYSFLFDAQYLVSS